MPTSSTPSWPSQESPGSAGAIARVPSLMLGVLDFAATRCGNPRGDLTSFLLAFEFDGLRLIDRPELHRMAADEFLRHLRHPSMTGLATLPVAFTPGCDGERRDPGDLRSK